MNDTIDLHIDESTNQENLWFKDGKDFLIQKLQEANTWTRLAVGTTILEVGFSKIPLISIPNSILDVGGGLGNLFEKINTKNVMPSDISGLANSLMTFVGAFSISASIGIEATAIGANLIRIATLASRVSIPLFILGYLLDHHSEIKEFLVNDGYDFIKEQYSAATKKFEETKQELKNHLGEPLFETVNNFTPDNIDKSFITQDNGELVYNFDHLDPTGSLNLKDKLEVSPSDIHNTLTEVSAELNAEPIPMLDFKTETGDCVADSANPFLKDNEIIQTETKLIPQNMFLSFDMSSSNLELIHLTKDDLRNFPQYSVQTSGPITAYNNKDLPWMHVNSRFLESNDKFFLYDGNGINRGIAFPLFMDKSTKLPIGLPLNSHGDFIERDALDVLKKEPHLFSDPGHIVNNMAFQLYSIHKAAVHATFKISKSVTNAVQNRLSEVKKVNIKEILKLKNDSLENLSKDLSEHEAELNKHQAGLSTTSGNSRTGKYCFVYDGIDASPIEEYLGDGRKVIVEMCFDRNPYLAQFE